MRDTIDPSVVTLPERVQIIEPTGQSTKPPLPPAAIRAAAAAVVLDAQINEIHPIEPAKSSTLARYDGGPVGLLKVAKARQLLAECKRVDEAKDLRDKAEAIRVYLRKQSASREAQNDAAEIKLRAERRLGELLEPDKEKRGGANGQRVSLPEGVTHKQSSRWQDVARVPEEKFEGYIREQREAPTGEVTTAGALRAAHTKAAKTTDATAKQADAPPPPSTAQDATRWASVHVQFQNVILVALSTVITDIKPLDATFAKRVATVKRKIAELAEIAANEGKQPAKVDKRQLKLEGV